MSNHVKICGIKICGIKSFEFIDICAQAGADYIGFVNFAKSPRHVKMSELKQLIDHTRTHAHINSVVLSVNSSPADIAQIAAFEPDYIQLHGDETPKFCQNLKATTKLKIIKVISVETIADIELALAFESIVDMLLFDTKAIEGAELPGGNGQAFNWELLKGQKFQCQTMLAGGLNASNVALAMQQSNINIVDVSTAVEISRGVKDKALIENFIQSAKGKI